MRWQASATSRSRTLLPIPLAQDKTVVVSLDDTSTNGQVYVYVGNKATTGNAVQQAGLAGGITYGVRVNSTGSTNTEVGILATARMKRASGSMTSGVGTFELVNLGDVKGKTGATLNSESVAAGVTNWLRPEDGAWSKDGKTFYFVTTATSHKRQPPLGHWSSPIPPIQRLGGTVKMLLNGSEGHVMLDNMTVADDGSILLQEDPGGNARLAKIWRYNPSTDTLVELAQHNPALFSGTVSGTGNITIDEESSGVVDISSFLTGVSGYDTTKYSYFLIADQIHKAVASPTSQVEIGELSVMVTAKASPAGTATWADAIGVASPELLDNSLTLGEWRLFRLQRRPPGSRRHNASEQSGAVQPAFGGRQPGLRQTRRPHPARRRLGRHQLRQRLRHRRS